MCVCVDTSPSAPPHTLAVSLIMRMLPGWTFSGALDLQGYCVPPKVHRVIQFGDTNPCPLQKAPKLAPQGEGYLNSHWFMRFNFLWIPSLVWKGQNSFNVWIEVPLLFFLLVWGFFENMADILFESLVKMYVNTVNGTRSVYRG